MTKTARLESRISGPQLWCKVFLASALVLFPPAAGAQAAEASECSACHEQASVLGKSVHATVRCLQCHPKHEAYPHPEGVPQTNCAACHASQAGEHARSVHGQAIRSGNQAAPGCVVCHGSAHEAVRSTTSTFRDAVPETCGMCHSKEAQQFRASVHGEAVAQRIQDAPVCTDCHGEHSILAASDTASLVGVRRIRETCGRCHGDLRLTRRFGIPSDRLTSFDASFHGLASKTGSQTVANCASCHGYHDVLPSSHPKSMTNVNNLGATCGKCHPGAGTRFALGTVHLIEGQEEAPPVRLARIFYQILIPLVIGLMALHHGGDWVRKLFQLRFSEKTPAPAAVLPPEVRMYPWERVQHALLVISFAVLVWSGFALKYPDQWWAWVLVRWESSWPVRGTVHRAAGAVMIALSVLHLISLVTNRRLREHWLTLWPRHQDVIEAAWGMAYSMGLLAIRPARSAHSYIEKAEYWAVVWGTLVMAVTGVMLWANNLMLTWLPKMWLDFATTVHFYEAVLATLAIVVWHFYTVIFDPDVYPMDPAWLTGVSVRKPRPHTVHGPPSIYLGPRSHDSTISHTD